MSDTNQKPKLPCKTKVLLWAAGLLLAYTVIGFFIVPAVIKSQMLKRLPALTHRQAAVQKVSFNPYALSFAVRGLALTESNGESFAGVERFHLQFQAMSSLAHGAWVFKDVTLSNAFTHVIRRKDGSFNFDNLMETKAAPPAKPAQAPALPAVLVQSLRVDNASLEADDLTTPTAFHDKWAPVNLHMTNLTTKSNAASPFVFSATTDADEKFAVSGQVIIQPLQALGRVNATAVVLKRYGPYLAAFTRAVVADGTVNAGADFQMSVGLTGLDAVITNGAVQLANLRVHSPDSGETVAAIPALSVNLIDASLGGRSLHVRSVNSSGGSLLVRQNHDGTVNLLALMAGSAPAASPSAPWTARVDEIAFNDYALAIEDQQPARPVKLDVSSLAFTIKDINSASNAPLPAAVSMRLNGQGSLSINGTVAFAPPSADLAVDLETLDLPPFAPYVPDEIRLILSKGQINLKGRAQGRLTTAGPDATFAGDVVVRNLAAADPVHDRSLVNFDQLAITGIDAAYPVLKLRVNLVALGGLSASVVIDTNRQINLLSVLATNPPRKAASAPASPPPAIDLAALVIDKASLHYVDESVEPHATFDLQELSGSVKGISSQPRGLAVVDFRGNVGQFSSFAVSGGIDPLAKDITLDVAVSVTNLELTPMSPYLEKYGGYPLNKGKLLLQLNYDVDHRRLAATNKVVIAGLTLGARNASTNATHLPIKLGVALLKDRQGKIDLDIPLSGSLDDPSFRVLPLVWQVVNNLLVKAATSPFSLLGRIVGGNGEELSSADFAPGQAVLAPSEEAKIKKLSEALYQRPALTLQIAGACSPAADGAVLARQHLQRRVNRLRAEEQAAAGQPVQDVDSIQLEPADYARLLQALYVRTFGTNLALPTNASAVASAPSPEQTTVLAMVPSSPEPSPRAGTQHLKGAEKLMLHMDASKPPPKAAPLKPAAVRPQPSAPAPSAPSSPDFAQMEQQLLAQIRVTDDELLQLEQERAKAVQSALLQLGQIQADRVFILAPNPLNRDAQGETRAIFSLE